MRFFLYDYKLATSSLLDCTIVMVLLHLFALTLDQAYNKIVFSLFCSDNKFNIQIDEREAGNVPDRYQEKKKTI
jgi:hypothetical protein